MTPAKALLAAAGCWVPDSGHHAGGRGFVGLNTSWFREALASATVHTVSGGRVRIVSSVGFVATKYVVFLDRGEGDCYASHDLEDLIKVIAGREKIIEEVAAADPALSTYVAKATAKLVVSEDFMEALLGHLPADTANQGRWQGLRRKLTGIKQIAWGRAVGEFQRSSLRLWTRSVDG